MKYLGICLLNVAVEAAGNLVCGSSQSHLRSVALTACYSVLWKKGSHESGVEPRDSSRRLRKYEDVQKCIQK